MIENSSICEVDEVRCVYCGQSGHRAHACPIRKGEAHAVLNAARAGDDVDSEWISQALEITGDMDRELPRWQVDDSDLIADTREAA